MTRIAICAPSTPITPDVAERVTTLAAREFPGLKLQFHEQCFVEDGHFAGPDAVRLAALLDCANDPQVDAVWFAKGGYGANRIAVQALASMNGSAREKVYLGYSDTGYLLAGLYRAGIGLPVHAPMPVDIRRDGGEDAVERTLTWLAHDTRGLEPSLVGEPSVAFNLMTLAMLCGTELMPDLTDHVVMVEEVAEYLYSVDRLFFHVTQHLRGIAGLRLGRISAVPENDRPFGTGAEEIARDWCARAGIPFLGTADIGHDAANRIVPFGLARTPARS
ncbi:LD-carboxypeptidase [Altererythrobacter sp. Root672]|uniref:LD-carboxypeptidase n=1 Tax=Altererythrobacter sp. Root672 TaxID=1736584 RepID=UPI0006F5FCBD|nr:LD-carboxypeptidase [Altererythrobacter sp. Root672]KRA83134.1 LD-carboxypeptidase [Altererythrobacter sp. Root672]